MALSMKPSVVSLARSRVRVQAVQAKLKIGINGEYRAGLLLAMR